MRTLLILLFIVTVMLQSQEEPKRSAQSAAFIPVHDEHSFGNPQEIAVSNVDLDLTVDFEKQTLSGTATLALKRNKPGTRKLVLDDENLAISKVEAAGPSGRFAPAKFTVGGKKGTLGAALTSDVTPTTGLVRVTYSSDPTASALQWLKPEQTAGKKHPYLYSQSEAAHGRSWIPLQDSPGVRVTYT